MTDETATAVIYLRVSTKEQAEMGGEAEGFSVPAQREACLNKVRSLGATVIQEFADKGESAKTAHRPELQRLLKFVTEHRVQYVVVHKVDRMARSMADSVSINLAFKAAGAQLVSCSENIDSTPTGKLMHNLMSSVAEFYSDNLATEVIKGSTQKAKKGGTPGRAPTGYMNVRVIEDGREVRTVALDPERAHLMRTAFELYATGQWTIRRLAGELEARGLTSRPTHRWPGKPLTDSNLHRLLRHPYYKGIVRYRGVEYEGKHEPLVSDALWQRAQDVLESQNYAGEKTRNYPHYLKGTVYCGSCKSRLIVHHAKGRRGGIYPYFVCIGRQQKRTQCTQRAMAIDVVEALVEHHYLRVQLFPELTEQMRTYIMSELNQQRSTSDNDRKELNRRIKQLESKRQKLLEAFYAEAIDTETLKREQSTVKAALEHAKQRLESLTGDLGSVEENLTQALALAANWYQVYLGSEPAERRMMNQAIFERLYVQNDETVEHEYAQPFAALLSGSIEREVTKRYLRSREAEHISIDEQWRQLSAKWAAEEDLVTSTRNPRDRVVVGGSNKSTLVGDEGLEPPTLSV